MSMHGFQPLGPCYVFFYWTRDSKSFFIILPKLIKFIERVCSQKLLRHNFLVECFNWCDFAGFYSSLCLWLVANDSWCFDEMILSNLIDARFS